MSKSFYIFILMLIFVLAFPVLVQATNVNMYLSNNTADTTANAVNSTNTTNTTTIPRFL